MQQVAQSEGRDLVVQAAVLAFASVLPDPAILFLGLAVFARRPQQVRLFEHQKIVARKPGGERACSLQCLRVAVLPAQEQHQDNAGIHAGFATGMRGFREIPDSLLLVSAQTHQRNRHFHCQRQASHDVVVRPQHQLGVLVLGRQFEDTLVVTARSDRIAQ